MAKSIIFGFFSGHFSGCVALEIIGLINMTIVYRPLKKY